MTYTVDPQLLERPIRILVVGCGGNGSAIVSGLPYLHQALLAFGHPGGLAVTLIDPDTVTETNCVRQPFCRTEIGFPKAIVLAHRINLFWGLNWQGMQATIQQLKKGSEVDFVISCVDTRKARRAIDKWVLNSRVSEAGRPSFGPSLLPGWRWHRSKPDYGRLAILQLIPDQS